MDDELRKFLEQLVGLRVWTAQEATEGGTGNLENIRQDLYKKICSSDPISRRPPYAKTTKMLPPRSLARFELNKPLTFDNVKEESWGSIYMTSLAITTKGEFLPKYEYDALPPDVKESGYVFPKGDTVKGFLESNPEASDFPNIIYH